MARSYDERDAAVAIDCPLCMAEPTYPCVDNETLKTVAVHTERTDELNDLVKRGAAAYEAEGTVP